MGYPLTAAGFAGLRKARGIQMCDLIEVTRLDGFVLRLTSWDRTLTMDGHQFVPAVFSATGATRMESGMKESAVDVQSIIEGTTIKIPDLRGGLYEGAGVVRTITDARQPWVVFRRDRYTVTAVKEDGQVFTGTLESGLAQEQQPVGGWFGANFTVRCQFVLGGPKCKKDVSADIYSGVTVLTVVYGRERFQFAADPATWPAGSPARADDYYRDGSVEWTSGPNINTKSQIVYYGQASRAVELLFPTKFAIQIGDTCKVKPGCDGLRDTCITKYANVANFGGSPYDPGADAMVTPAALQQ